MRSLVRNPQSRSGNVVNAGRQAPGRRGGRDLLPLQVGPVTAASLEPSDIDLGRAEIEGVALAPIFDSLHDAVVVTDAAGEVLLVNDAFTRLVGWRADEGPFRPPYPWWPADQELAARGEFELHSRAGTSVWVSLTTTTVAIPGQPGVPAWATTLRDVTAERAARARRAAAADLAGKFATAHDLTAVVITAVAGFQELFDGDSVVEVATGDGRSLFTASGPVDGDHQPARALPPRGGGRRRTPGRPADPAAPPEACRAWCAPTQVVSETEIVGSLLARLGPRRRSGRDRDRVRRQGAEPPGGRREPPADRPGDRHPRRAAPAHSATPSHASASSRTPT
jgi:hypothetical protein